MVTDDRLEVDDAVTDLQTFSQPPSEVRPHMAGDRLSLFEHELEGVERMLPNQAGELVWECQKCGARAEDLGALPVACDE